MKDFALRTDLERAVIDGFALPLGIAPPPGSLQAPAQGYTIAYNAAQDEDPDTYSFHVVVSHERVRPLLLRAFELLPDHVFGIVEIGSRDAYRSTDVFIGEHEISRDQFLRGWRRYEPFLLEDGSIAAGANSEDPFIEVFIDQWKGISIHVPLSMREDVEALLQEQGLEEVVQTWPDSFEDRASDEGGDESPVRPVLDLSDEFSPDVDEVLLNLRHDWRLELNVDRESNVDERGRELGTTLWHAVVIVDKTPTGEDESPQEGAYASIWATASSLSEMEELIVAALEDRPEWTFGEIYTIDRVAFDERPEELARLNPANRVPRVHLVSIEPWGSPPPPPEAKKQQA